MAVIEKGLGLAYTLLSPIARPIPGAYRLAVIRAGARNADPVDGLRLLVVEAVAVVEWVLARRVARLAGRLEALERAVDPPVLVARDELRRVAGSVGLVVEAALLVERVQVRQIGFDLKGDVRLSRYQFSVRANSKGPRNLSPKSGPSWAEHFHGWFMTKKNLDG